MNRRLVFDLGFAKDAVALVDARLSNVVVSAETDADGTLDALNHLSGFGFTALQTFVSAVVAGSTLSKRRALEIEPTHTCGVSIAGLVNAAANHWKHRSEWSKTDPSPEARRTIEVFERLAVDPWGEYALANALHAILAPHPTRFASLIPFLERWAERVLEP